MKIGLRIDTRKKRFVIAIDDDYFSWIPCLVENSAASPSEYFNCYSDVSWLYCFLFFTVFYAKGYDY